MTLHNTLKMGNYTYNTHYHLPTMSQTISPKENEIVNYYYGEAAATTTTTTAWTVATIIISVMKAIEETIKF